MTWHALSLRENEVPEPQCARVHHPPAKHNLWMTHRGPRLKVRRSAPPALDSEVTHRAETQTSGLPGWPRDGVTGLLRVSQPSSLGYADRCGVKALSPGEPKRFRIPGHLSGPARLCLWPWPETSWFADSYAKLQMVISSAGRTAGRANAP